MSPNYYAIIPANVRYDFDLTANSKLLFGEITALCNKEGYCWATNKYFSELYQVSETSISKWVSQLIDKGYIVAEMRPNKTGVERILKIPPGCTTFVGEGVEHKLKTGVEEKFNHNNTNTNNTLNTSTTLTGSFAEADNSEPLNEKKGKTKKLREKIKVADPLFSPCIEIYNNFIKKVLDAPGKFDGAEGNAMKKIIAYLKTVCKSKNENLTEEELITNVQDSWTYILNNYKKWDQFHQRQLKLVQINSNLTNIIAAFKGVGQKVTSNSIENQKKLKDILEKNKNYQRATN